MKIAALDLSLTSTGFAVASSIDPVAWRWKPDHLGTIEPNGMRGMERLDWIRQRVIDLIDGADLVVIENYAYSRANQAHQIGELGGVVRMTFHDLGFPWVALNPSVVKKIATGKGNAPKNEVLVAAVQRLEYDGASSDEADALWLLEAALIGYGIVKSDLPKTHLAALEKVEWPTLTKPDEGRS